MATSGNPSTSFIEPRFVSVIGAAHALGLGRSRVYELIASGELESVLLGQRRLVPVAGIDAFVERLRANPDEVTESRQGNTEGSAR